MKLNDFISPESSTILTWKNGCSNGRSKFHMKTSADVILGMADSAKKKVRGGRYCVSGAHNSESCKTQWENEGSKNSPVFVVVRNYKN